MEHHYRQVKETGEGVIHDHDFVFLNSTRIITLNFNNYVCTLYLMLF